MFEAFVVNLLNTILCDYVDNLSSSQLNIGIWNGDVNLHNLTLKTSAFDSLNLPIFIHYGLIGSLQMSIPWNDLKNKPIKIHISDIYAISTPKSTLDYDYNAHLDAQLKLKFEKLAILDSKADISTKDNSFLTQLATKIIDNLQISIKNIHIRYHDPITTRVPFSFGFTLDEVSAISTDSLFNPDILNQDPNVIYKLLKLNNLAIYCDTITPITLPKTQAEFQTLIDSLKGKPPQHLLKPVSGKANLTLYKTSTKSIPKTTAILEFNELGFELDDEQYKTAITLLEAFEMYNRSFKYKRFHPPKTISPKIDPLAWFKFAATCILDEIHEQNVKFTWDYLKQRRDDRKSYIKLRKLFLGGTQLSLDVCFYNLRILQCYLNWNGN